MKKLLLIGAGGHCRSVIDVVRSTEEYEIVGAIGLAAEVGNLISGISVVGTDAELVRYTESADECLITVGQIGVARARPDIWKTLQELSVPMATVVASTAWVSSEAKLGTGTIVMHQALINAGAQIGDNCIVNTKALVEHDSVIGDHVHISTAAIVNGGVGVGSGSFVGSGSIIFHGIALEEQSVVSAGSIVDGKP